MLQNQIKTSKRNDKLKEITPTIYSPLITTSSNPGYLQDVCGGQHQRKGGENSLIYLNSYEMQGRR